MDDNNNNTNENSAAMAEITSLLDESVQSLSEQKEAKKTINSMAKDAEKALGLSAATIKQCKNLYHTKGKGWAGGPLTLDSDAKVKDKLSQLFIKLRDTVVTLRDAGQTEWLDDYFAALASEGINITLAPIPAKTSAPDEVKSLISSLCAYQAVVDESTETIKEEHGQKAEDLNFSPKSAYSKVLSLYNKVKDGKDVDDEYQDKITELEMIETAFNLIYDGGV